MDERSLQIRSEWKLHDSVEIYSNSKNKWYSGEISKIFCDDEGEWLEVRYVDSMTKQVQRYCTDIRPKRKKKKNGFRSLIPPQILISKHNSNDDIVHVIRDSDDDDDGDGGYDENDKDDNNKNNNNNCNESVAIMESEIEIRESWTKGHSVEIYSNTHGEWNRAEIVDIIRDDEGEWLNCFWVRSNGQTMTKQLQRYSSDIRPCISAHSLSENCNNNNTGIATQTTHADVLRKAPSFHADQDNHSHKHHSSHHSSHNHSRQSTFNHPASSPARRSKKLRDIAEIDEHAMTDSMNGLSLNKKSGQNSDERGRKRKGSLTHLDFVGNNGNGKGNGKGNGSCVRNQNVESMNASEISDFIASLGSEYAKYCKCFSKVSGAELAKFSENALELEFGICTKVHRHKILLEISKNSACFLDGNDGCDVHLLNAVREIDVLNWDSSKVKEWCDCNEILKVYSNNFRNNGIDGMLLLDLNSNDLKMIGIKKKHNAIVMKIIQKLSKQSFPETHV